MKHANSKSVPTIRSHTPKFQNHLFAFAGLQMLRGNQSPYFTLTGAEKTYTGRYLSGGCIHEKLLEQWPELLPLSRLHLSDIRGEPMHAEANAIYWAGGVLGGCAPLGSQYHGGSGTCAKDGAQCLQILSEHLRVSERDARGFVGELNRAHAVGGSAQVGVRMHGIADQLRPQWRAEAEEAVRMFGLVIFGDPWPIAQ